MGKVYGNWVTGLHSGRGGSGGRACKHDDIYTKVNHSSCRHEVSTDNSICFSCLFYDTESKLTICKVQVCCDGRLFLVRIGDDSYVGVVSVNVINCNFELAVFLLNVCGGKMSSSWIPLRGYF